MLQALRRFAHLFSRDENQFSLDLAEPARPRTSEELEAELQKLGLTRAYRVKLTRNRTVVVSHSSGDLRIHQSFLEAPQEVLGAIVVFVQGRTRAVRADARRTIIKFPIKDSRPKRQAGKPHRTQSDDVAIAERLAVWHARYNADTSRES